MGQDAYGPFAQHMGLLSHMGVGQKAYFSFICSNSYDILIKQ